MFQLDFTTLFSQIPMLIFARKKTEKNTKSKIKIKDLSLV